MLQRALHIILSGVRLRMSPVYLNEVIVFYKDNESQLDLLDHVLTILEEGGVKLNIKKCFFFRDNVD